MLAASANRKAQKDKLGGKSRWAVWNGVSIEGEDSLSQELVVKRVHNKIAPNRIEAV